MRRSRHRQAGAVPALLVTFVAAVLVMVLAMVAIGLTGSDWADAAAIVLLLALLGLMLTQIMRQLRDDEPPATDQAAPSAANQEKT